MIQVSLKKFTKLLVSVLMAVCVVLLPVAVECKEAEMTTKTETLPGGLKQVSNYKNKKLDGERKTYYQNRKLKSVSNYKDDVLDGEYKEYYESGAIKQVQNFKKGKPSQSKVYYKSGKLIE